MFALAVHPEDQARVGRAVQACLDGETREFDIEYRIPHKDGSEHWHLTRGTVLRDPKGRPIRFIGSRVDITDLKRAEEALRKSEQRFRTFVDHATDAFFLFDDGNVVLDVLAIEMVVRKGTHRPEYVEEFCRIVRHFLSDSDD